jgi:serine/threonine protein kinase
MWVSIDSNSSSSLIYLKHSEVRKECCCPTFIIALAGSWLTILGAITTIQYVAQRLTDYLWLGNSRVCDDAHVISVAHVLYALGRSLDSLDTFYQNLEVQPVANGHLHPRFLPSINSYPSHNTTTVRFTYVKPLELDNTCMTFLATSDSDGEDIVVKFVQSYGDAAHQNLASSGMAPDLLYYGPIVQDGHSYGELKMVVMGYVPGETLAQRFESKPIPRDVIQAIRDGITTIHDAGYVYGDLRRPNVMIASTVDGNDDADLGKLVRFIDFDWAGKAGDARYPLHLSSAICKTAGTSEYELITKEHDIKMLNAL